MTEVPANKKKWHVQIPCHSLKGNCLLSLLFFLLPLVWKGDVVRTQFLCCRGRQRREQQSHTVKGTQVPFLSHGAKLPCCLPWSQLLTMDYYEIEKNTSILFPGFLVTLSALIYMASYQEA